MTQKSCIHLFSENRLVSFIYIYIYIFQLTKTNRLIISVTYHLLIIILENKRKDCFKVPKNEDKISEKKIDSINPVVTTLGTFKRYS